LIEVDEKGTEAAAATSVEMGLTSAPVSQFNMKVYVELIKNALEKLNEALYEKSLNEVLQTAGDGSFLRSGACRFLRHGNLGRGTKAFLQGKAGRIQVTLRLTEVIAPLIPALAGKSIDEFPQAGVFRRKEYIHGHGSFFSIRQTQRR
jgi:hypothetical protein